MPRSSQTRNGAISDSASRPVRIDSSTHAQTTKD